jgi:hypothetical protein
MNKGFAEIINLIVKEHGKEALVDGTAKDLLEDYCGKRFRKEADIFWQILDKRCNENQIW